MAGGSSYIWAVVDPVDRDWETLNDKASEIVVPSSRNIMLIMSVIGTGDDCLDASVTNCTLTIVESLFVPRCTAAEISFKLCSRRVCAITSRVCCDTSLHTSREIM